MTKKEKALRWLVTFVVLLLALRMLGLDVFPGQDVAGSKASAAKPASYSDVYEHVQGGKISSLDYESGSSAVRVVLADGSVISTQIPPGSDIIKVAQSKGAKVDVRPAPTPSSWGFVGRLALVIFPIVLFCVFLYWLQRKQMDGIKNATRPDKGGFKGGQMIDPASNKIRLSDVAGNEQAKLEVSEIIQFLKEPEQYHSLGARSPKGILMSGPPGTGKTLLAKAIAGEAGVPFFSVSGSDFMEVFVGVGASRVRGMFEQAKKMSPAIIFVDEIDSIGRQRSGAGSMEHGERDQTLNQLLTEMDGFDENVNVVVIAATNRSDILDEALTRPGRFDREVSMSLPDRTERAEILEVHVRKVPLSIGVDLNVVAAGTPGFSGADLANLVNEAAVLAARSRVKLVTQQHFEDARDKVIMGVARNPLRNQEDRRVIAYHEAGHAIVAHFTPEAEPVHKISIVPRGRALGVTMQLAREDSYNHSQARLEGDVAVLMGGRAAEDLVIGHRTTGASNDFMRATVMSRRMITSWGMDPDFGPLSIDGERGNEYASTTVWSEAIKVEADRKVQALVKKQYAAARTLLENNLAALHAVAQALLVEETVDADRFVSLVEAAAAVPA